MTPAPLTVGKRVKYGVVGLLLLALGLVFLAATTVKSKDLIRFHTLDGRTVGKVVEQDTGRRCDSMVEFEVQGKTYQVPHEYCPGFGEEVKVRYDLRDPSRGTGDGLLTAYLLYPLQALIFLALGSIVSVCGGLVLYSALVGKIAGRVSPPRRGKKSRK